MRVQRVRVGDVLRLDRKAVEPDPAIEYVSIGVRSFGKGIFHYEPKLGGELGSLRFFEVRPGSLVVSNIKGWEGAIAMASDQDAGSIASNRFLAYVPTDQSIDVSWARWYFLSERGIEQIQQASPGSADRNRTLAIERFEALEIPLPPIEEQRRAAARLDLILQGSTRLRLLSDRATAVDSALHEGSVDVLFSKITASSQPVEELGDVRGGIQRTPDREPGANPARYLTVAHVGRDSISFDDPRYFEVNPEELARRRLESGDVLIIEGNGSAEQIGRAALFPGSTESFVHQNHVIRVRPGPAVEPDFLNLYLNSPPGRRAVQAQARTSSGLRSLSVGRIKQIAVPVPALGDQRELVREVRRLQSQSSRLALLRTRSDTLRRSLLPAALNEVFAELS